MKVCLTIAVCAVSLAASAIANAQDDPQVDFSWRKTAAAQAEKDFTEAQQSYSTSLAGYDSRIQSEVPALNSSISGLTNDRDRLAAQTDFFNNIPSLGTKAEMEAWAADARKRWDADRGPTISESNPYNDDFYNRYYTNEKLGQDGKPISGSGGELAVSIVQGDYATLQRDSAIWDQSRSRARDLAASLNNDYQQVASRYGEVTALKARAVATQAAADAAAQQLAAANAVRQQQTATPNQQQSQSGGWKLGDPVFGAGGLNPQPYQRKSNVLP